MDVVPFRAEHIEGLDLQDAQVYLGEWITPERAVMMEGFPSFTGLADGAILGFAGVIPAWGHRSIAWAILSRRACKYMVPITRATRAFLDQLQCRRIEAAVDVGFEPGHRWIQMLGFGLETPIARAYNPLGGDCSLYARVRD
jgi:hypothetical protein